MPEPMVFDRIEALRRLMKSEKLLRDVIGIFLRDLPRLTMQLTNAIEAKSASGLQLATHSLKGSSSQVGGQVVTDCAWKIEQLAADGDLTAAQELVPSLCTDLEQLRTALEAELAKGSI